MLARVLARLLGEGIQFHPPLTLDDSKEESEGIITIEDALGSRWVFQITEEGKCVRRVD